MTQTIDTLLRNADCGGVGSTVGCYRTLHRLAQITRGPAAHILEVGTHWGVSAATLAHGAPGSRVTTIDHARVDQAYRDALARTWDVFGVQDRVRCVTGPSRDMLPTIPGPFDLVFLDGSHIPTEVLSDLRLTMDNAPVIAMHDIWLGDTWTACCDIYRRTYPGAIVFLLPATREPERASHPQINPVHLPQPWQDFARFAAGVYPNGCADVWRRPPYEDRHDVLAPGMGVLVRNPAP